MSWMTMREIGARIAQLQALQRDRPLTAPEATELDRLDTNRTARLKRLVAAPPRWKRSSAA